MHSVPGLPQFVRIYEVGPRDGLQAEATIISTADKATFIRMLASAGLSAIEATSFVSPDWIPQLADSAELMALIGPDLIGRPVLVPNKKGLQRAIAAGATSVAVFASATEAFASRNLNTTRRGALDAAVSVARDAVAAGLRVRGYVSMCFGDPWEGAVAFDAVVSATHELLAAGCYEVSLGDTIGVGTAGQVRDLLAAHESAGVSMSALALHFHDTYAQALANVHAGLQAGVTCFDASAGGIGGCPFAGSATGNLATEDLLWMLEGLGIETGVDLLSVADAGAWIADLLGRPLSRVASALVRPAAQPRRERPATGRQ